MGSPGHGDDQERHQINGNLCGQQSLNTLLQLLKGGMVRIKDIWWYNLYRSYSTIAGLYTVTAGLSHWVINVRYRLFTNSLINLSLYYLFKWKNTTMEWAHRPIVISNSWLNLYYSLITSSSPILVCATGRICKEDINT